MPTEVVIALVSAVVGALLNVPNRLLDARLERGRAVREAEQRSLLELRDAIDSYHHRGHLAGIDPAALNRHAAHDGLELTRRIAFLLSCVDDLLLTQLVTNLLDAVLRAERGSPVKGSPAPHKDWAAFALYSYLHAQRRIGELLLGRRRTGHPRHPKLARLSPRYREQRRQADETFESIMRSMKEWAREERAEVTA